MTLAQLAERVGRSEKAVQEFLHRNRIVIGNTVKRNLVQQLLTTKFGNPTYFKPTRDFYKAISITQMRWWDIYYGRKQVTSDEYLRIAIHLKITMEEAHDARQLGLFEE